MLLFNNNLNSNFNSNGNSNKSPRLRGSVAFPPAAPPETHTHTPTTPDVVIVPKPAAPPSAPARPLSAKSTSATTVGRADPGGYEERASDDSPLVFMLHAGPTAPPVHHHLKGVEGEQEGEMGQATDDEVDEVCVDTWTRITMYIHTHIPTYARTYVHGYSYVHTYKHHGTGLGGEQEGDVGQATDDVVDEVCVYHPRMLHSHA
jgi:hypothetical protein